MMNHPIRLLHVLLIAITLTVVTGCADEVLSPPSVDDAEARAVDRSVDPFAVLAGRTADPSSAGVLSKRNPVDGTSGTFGLIQDLSPAPNGELLVSDVFSGIATFGGQYEIAMPGVTAAGPIGRGSMWATVGPVGDGASCETAATTFEDCGQAVYRASKGTIRPIANLFEYEAANNPDGLGIDSNPYDVLSLGGRGAIVVDAAGNDLLKVDNQGRVELMAIFPSGDPVEISPGVEVAPEAVPTSIAVGPDGYYYVGELTGFPAPAGVSGIWRISPDASGAICGSSPDCVRVFDGGFTSIIDLAFHEGTLYVAELDESSWLAFAGGPVAPSGGTINACDTDTGLCTETPVGPFLNAITFGADGTLWATTAGGSQIAAVQP